MQKITNAVNAAKIIKSALTIFILLFLASCNAGSLGEGLESTTPSQNVNNAQTPASPQTADQTQLGQTPITTANQAAVTGTKPIAFLPVSNAPQTAISTLTTSLRNSAISNNVAVVNSVQDGALYQVKGYFSALEDGSGTLLVYVWDVLDRGNKRVYRISGQEQTSSKSADPWNSVTPSMIDRVAGSTLSQLKSWLAKSG